MLRVFLVEDEIVIRNGIKNSIDWEKEGYQFAGEASDGELALPMILKEKPDILITDIRMPFMDGLEMSRVVKRELPDIKILILSGYDDFTYAKQAIKLGVTEYLLKPVSSAKLLEILKEVSGQIAAEQEERELKQVYLQQMRETFELKKIDFFGQLVSGKLSFADAVEAGKKYGISLGAQFYKIILFKLLSAADINNGMEEVPIAAFEEIEESEAELPYVYSFQRSVEGWAFLLTADTEGQMRQREKGFVDGLCKIAEKYPGTGYFGGVGKTVCRLSELKESFEYADRAFAGRFTHDGNAVVFNPEISDREAEDAFPVNSFRSVEQLHHMVEKFLSSGSQEEIESFVGACFNEITADNFQSLMMRQYIIMDIYVTVMSFCERFEADGEEKQEAEDLQKDGDALKEIIQSSESVEEIKIYIQNLLRQAIEVRNTASGRRYSDIIRMAKAQIAGAYMSEEISLNSVAAEVGMSPSYFSTIFSREMGKTFVEYLTEIRMEKAKELLTCSAMKTSEVGYGVGYKDAHYFSYLFKKTQGCSPKEYRSSRKGKEK